MSEFQKIGSGAWNTVGWPKNLATVPLRPEDFSKKYGIEPTESDEEGLGKSLTFMFAINGTLFVSQSFPDGSEEAQFLNISVQSTENDSKKALQKLLRALNMTEQGLVWVNNDLGTPQWILRRLDENGHETEMFRFQEEDCAEAVRQQYEDKGHKQLYMVHHAT